MNPASPTPPTPARIEAPVTLCREWVDEKGAIVKRPDRGEPFWWEPTPADEERLAGHFALYRALPAPAFASLVALVGEARALLGECRGLLDSDSLAGFGVEKRHAVVARIDALSVEAPTGKDRFGPVSYALAMLLDRLGCAPPMDRPTTDDDILDHVRFLEERASASAYPHG